MTIEILPDISKYVVDSRWSGPISHNRTNTNDDVNTSLPGHNLLVTWLTDKIKMPIPILVATCVCKDVK